MNRFFRYQLRTSDVAGARAFYAPILGDAVADISPLPPQAIERGAPAHWLGQLAVEHVEQAARSFTDGGAVQLGPWVSAPGGGKLAVFRDPGGAVVALASGVTDLAPLQPKVIWHQLNAANASQTASVYCELFGWQLAAERDHGEHGLHRELAWQAGEPSFGSVVDIAGRPGVHPHWLFHFQVPSLELAIAHVRGGGGTVLGPTQLASGALIAMCEDPQGAAFMLHEPRRGET